ncbi:MAG: type 1 glutamine amidotransferase [Candidatus Aminicenantales bacterium]
MGRKKHVRVAIIDNSINHELYSPVGHWTQYLDEEWISFRAKKYEFPHLEEGFTHLILTGSESSIMEREPWVDEEAEVVRQAVQQGIAVLGSCYGHQLLAFALLGENSIRRCENPEAGWIPITIARDHGFFRPRKRAYVFSLHFDEVVNLPKTYEVLASTEKCHVQAFQLKARPVWGLQIHPEIDIPTGKRLLEDLVHLNLDHNGLFKKALASPPRDSGLISQIVRTFLEA